MKLVDEFLSLKCSGDVLNAAGPVKNAAKEISESMSLIHAVKSTILREPMKYHIVDLCAGNALTSIIAIHLLPIISATAIDIKPRARVSHLEVKRFRYVQGDIYDDLLWMGFPRPFIVVSSHPCGDLARVIVIKASEERFAVMPCCLPKKLPDSSTERFVAGKLGKYAAWAFCLARLSGGEITEARHCLSPARLMVKKGLA